jgi:hypothetical protein
MFIRKKIDKRDSSPLRVFVLTKNKLWKEARLCSVMTLYNAT